MISKNNGFILNAISKSDCLFPATANSFYHFGRFYFFRPFSEGLVQDMLIRYLELRGDSLHWIALFIASAQIFSLYYFLYHFTRNTQISALGAIFLIFSGSFFDLTDFASLNGRLADLFTIIAFLFFNQKDRGKKYYWASFFSFFIAVGCKENSLALIGILMAISLFEKSFKKQFPQFIPFILVGLIPIFSFIKFYSSISFMGSSEEPYSLGIAAIINSVLAFIDGLSIREITHFLTPYALLRGSSTHEYLPIAVFSGFLALILANVKKMGKDGWILILWTSLFFFPVTLYTGISPAKIFLSTVGFVGLFSLAVAKVKSFGRALKNPLFFLIIAFLFSVLSFNQTKKVKSACGPLYYTSAIYENIYDNLSPLPYSQNQPIILIIPDIVPDFQQDIFLEEMDLEHILGIALKTQTFRYKIIRKKGWEYLESDYISFPKSAIILELFINSPS